MESYHTYIIPVALQEVDARRSPLDSGTVDQDVNVAAHDAKRPVEESSNCVHVAEVALDDLQGTSEPTDSVHRVHIWLLTRFGWTLDKTDGSASLGHGNCTRRTDA